MRPLRLSMAYRLLGVRFGRGELGGWPAVLVLGAFVCRGRLACCELDGRRRNRPGVPGPVRIVCRLEVRR